MKIQFNPTSNQTLILSVLKVVEFIDILDLANVLVSLHCGEVSFSSLVNALCKLSKYKSSLDLFPEPEVSDYFRIPSGGRSEFEDDIAQLEFIGLIYIGGYLNNITPYGKTSLTEEGERFVRGLEKNRILLLRPKPELQTSVFIACAFGYDEIDRFYHEHLVSACSSLNYNPVRVDMSEPTQTITDAIMSGITESSCVIADLTHARPSVYFEVGYAHGLGIPILLTGRKDHFHGVDDNARIHFDLQQYKISFWTVSSDGKFKWDSPSMEPKRRLAALIPSLKKSAKSKVG
jgi:hypothetical protein